MERMLEYISLRVPYVVLGHSKDIEDIYVYNRRTLIRMVEQRRQKHLGMMAQPTEQPYLTRQSYLTEQLFHEKEDKYI